MPAPSSPSASSLRTREFPLLPHFAGLIPRMHMSHLTSIRRSKVAPSHSDSTLCSLAGSSPYCQLAQSRLLLTGSSQCRQLSSSACTISTSEIEVQNIRMYISPGVSFTKALWCPLARVNIGAAKLGFDFCMLGGVAVAFRRRRTNMRRLC